MIGFARRLRSGMIVGTAGPDVIVADAIDARGGDVVRATTR